MEVMLTERVSMAAVGVDEAAAVVSSSDEDEDEEEMLLGAMAAEDDEEAMRYEELIGAAALEDPEDPPEEPPAAAQVPSATPTAATAIFGAGLTVVTGLHPGKFCPGVSTFSSYVVFNLHSC